MENLKIIAESSLRKNILNLPSGHYVTAGQNQFLTLWTRDFCHSVRGLIAIGEADVAKEHLSLLLNSLREDGLVPRVVDNRLVQFRVSWQSARKLIPLLPSLKIQDPLKPQYTDEHGSCAIDSNLLVILASLQLRSIDESWWRKHEEQLKRVLAYYSDKVEDGLITQTPFADWQDSVSRQGVTFLTNLFYFLALERLKNIGWKIRTDTNELLKKIKQTFYAPDMGVYLSLKGSSIVSIDGNLLALEASEFLDDVEKKSLWKCIQKHPILTNAQGFLGMCSYPNYDRRNIALHVRLANLHAYHGEIAWSWLIGLGLKVAKLMDDKEMIEKQLRLISKLLNRDKEVLEIYVPKKDWRGWESWLLRSERPFAWGAAYIIDSLKA